MNTLEDFEKIKPGRIDAIKNWFINIKTYDGKKKNTVFEDGRLLQKNETLEIIEATHEEWRKLKEGLGGNEEYRRKLEEKRKNFFMN